MKQNGQGYSSWRMDGLVDVNNTISGYNVGLDFELASNGNTGATFYQNDSNRLQHGHPGPERGRRKRVEFSECTISGGIGSARHRPRVEARSCSRNCSITGTGRNGSLVDRPLRATGQLDVL